MTDERRALIDEYRLDQHYEVCDLVSWAERAVAMLESDALALEAIQAQCAGHADEFSQRVWNLAQEALAR